LDFKKLKQTRTADVPSLLEGLGFRLIAPRAKVYLNHKENLIIKKGNLLYDICQESPLYPFLIETRLVKDASEFEWIVQPRARRGEYARKALRQIREAVGNKYFMEGDIHIGNTGYYMGKPILFDW